MFSYSAIFLQTQESEVQENYFNGACNTLDCKNECCGGRPEQRREPNIS
jgi:tryptophanyl-tRNA synthetase